MKADDAEGEVFVSNRGSGEDVGGLSEEREGNGESKGVRRFVRDA